MEGTGRGLGVWGRGGAQAGAWVGYQVGTGVRTQAGVPKAPQGGAGAQGQKRACPTRGVRVEGPWAWARLCPVSCSPAAPQPCSPAAELADRPSAPWPVRHRPQPAVPSIAPLCAGRSAGPRGAQDVGPTQGCEASARRRRALSPWTASPALGLVHSGAGQGHPVGVAALSTQACSLHNL